MLFGLAHHPHHARVPVHVLLQERLDGGFRFGDRRRESDQLLVVVRGRHRPTSAAQRRAACCASDTTDADQMGNQLAHQLGAAPVLVETGIMRVDLGDDRPRSAASTLRSSMANRPARRPSSMSCAS